MNKYTLKYTSSYEIGVKTLCMKYKEKSYTSLSHRLQ